MSSLLQYLISPRGALLVLLTGAMWIACRPRSILARRVVLLAAVGYSVAATSVVPAALTRVWAYGYHRFDRSDVSGRPTAVVLLGAGDERVAGWTDQMATAGPLATARVMEAWRVYQLIAPDWVVSSGGAPNGASIRPSSILMRDALVGLGVPASRILLESYSLDTRDEAVLIGPMLRARGVVQIVLVTSTVHMRRSIGAFRAVGINAVPAIADTDSSRPWRDRYLPSGRGLKLSSQLAHEVVGLPYYWLRGWWRPRPVLSGLTLVASPPSMRQLTP
jgi:uncharacterized SAM-binding protein YcdF (DUF218 family)